MDTCDHCQAANPQLLECQECLIVVCRTCPCACDDDGDDDDDDEESE